MMNQNVMRGLGLIAIALFFGVQAAGYELGSLSKAGPGLFPLIVSSIVGLIGVLMIVQARFEAPEPMRFPLKSVALVLVALVGFVLISTWLNMLPAIVFLVFVSTLAGSHYRVMRNLKIVAVLVAIAYAFQYFLSLQLPLPFTS